MKKKLLIISALIAIISLSCKKNYNCKCDVKFENLGGGNGSDNSNKVFYVKKSKKDEAESGCNDFKTELEKTYSDTTSYSSYSVSCDLILE